MGNKIKLQKLASIASNHYHALIKERLTIFSLFFLIFTSMCVGTYYAAGIKGAGICDNNVEKNIVLICMGMIMLFIAIIFFFLLHKVSFNIVKSINILRKTEDALFKSDSLKLFLQEENYSCCSHTACFNSMLLLSCIAYILLLVSIWYPPPECKKHSALVVNIGNYLIDSANQSLCDHKT